MADEAPKPYDIESQPAILSPPLTSKGKRPLSAANEEDPGGPPRFHGFAASDEPRSPPSTPAAPAAPVDEEQ